MVTLSSDRICSRPESDPGSFPGFLKGPIVFLMPGLSLSSPSATVLLRPLTAEFALSSRALDHTSSPPSSLSSSLGVPLTCRIKGMVLWCWFPLQSGLVKKCFFRFCHSYVIRLFTPQWAGNALPLSVCWNLFICPDARCRIPQWALLACLLLELLFTSALRALSAQPSILRMVPWSLQVFVLVFGCFLSH